MPDYTQNELLLLEKSNLSGYNIYIGRLKWEYKGTSYWFSIYYNKKCKNRDYSPENVVDTSLKTQSHSITKKKLSFSHEIVDTPPTFCYVLVCLKNVLDWFDIDSTKINIQQVHEAETAETAAETAETAAETAETMPPVDPDDGTSDEYLRAQLNLAELNEQYNKHIKFGGSNVGTIIHITENDFFNISTDNTVTITGKNGYPVTLPGTITFYPKSTYDPHKDTTLLSLLKDDEILLIKNWQGDRLIYAFKTNHDGKTRNRKRLLKIISGPGGGYKKHKKTQRRLNTRKNRKNNKKKCTIRKIIKK